MIVLAFAERNVWHIAAAIWLYIQNRLASTSDQDDDERVSTKISNKYPTTQPPDKHARCGGNVDGSCTQLVLRTVHRTAC